MKKILYSLSVLFLLFSCSGKDGEVGPKGDTGAAGPKGETGATGSNGSQAYIYDFNLDVTQTPLGGYKFKVPIESQEFVMVYLMRMDDFYTSLPYKGYAFDINKKFLSVDMHYEYASFNLYVDNSFDLPKGSTFKFRAVVIKGIPGSRLNVERYQNYENLKADFNLGD